MPDLPGASPEIDRAMFDYVYSVVCPDQMKVYPCEVVPWTIIEKWHKKGLYVPYFEKNPDDLIDVVRYSMMTCPNWVRLPRVIRDIPRDYIQCGNTIANLRQVIDQKLDAEGVVSMDIRSREIGRHSKYYGMVGNYNSYYYYANGGHDYFIAYESYDLRALFGFIRLRIVDPGNMTKFDVLRKRGLVRELHVYGDTRGVGLTDRRGCQHTGIGGGLLRLAEKKTMEKGLYGIVVISGEGVKGYYEKKGYKDIDSFMVKDFWWFEVWFWMLVCYLKKFIGFIC
jgi:ELP3 family radical SAM enzyme/protein acetyltransferase